jgi:hypothetical protein
LRDLLVLIAERGKLEPRIDREFESGKASALAAFDDAYQDIIIRFAQEKETAERELHQAREDIVARYRAERPAAEQDYRYARARALQQYASEKEAARAELQETRWTLNAVFEGKRSGLETRSRETGVQLTDALTKARAIEREAKAYLEACRQAHDFGEDEKKSLAKQKDPFVPLFDALATAEGNLHELRELRLPRYFKGERLLFLYALVWLVVVYPCILVCDSWLWGILGSIVGVVVLSLVSSLWLYSVARRQVAGICIPLFDALWRVERLAKQCQNYSTVTFHKQMGEARRAFRKEVRQVKEKYKGARVEMKHKRRTLLRTANERFRDRREAIREIRMRDWARTTEKYRRSRTNLQERFDSDSRELQVGHDQELAELETRHEREWTHLVSMWQQGLSRLRAEIEDINQECGHLFPAWDSAHWGEWSPTAEVPTAIRFGEYHVDLSLLPNGLSRNPRLKVAGSTRFRLPALLPYVPRCSLLIQTSDDGRNPAVLTLQDMMYRLLTSLPPGKVRFTIIDPVGLGQNFASFMHLADYDEALVTSRIWTEVPHIEQRLADLTAHMETVIQKYLRNQFQTIEEYNTHAGEVAEPYRVLVLANFPVNFSTEAARRLVSIVNSGPRCGVHTLISVDMKHALPQGFNLADLDQPGVNLVWEDGHFVWQDHDFADYPLELEAPPQNELELQILHDVGLQAKEAKRVEVPFEFVAPAPEDWWTGDSRPGISVPLGRVGATKRQHLSLGQGTAQHVLIAGKTGSGKSTLLHALISNLALLYSPDEIHLYLVDFKKGVEFKTYAAHELPHARVVAIESEREFGLSVLQRLDAELKLRAEKFRAVGAQDLRTYRQLNGNQPVPRILMIVDEFQEFFVEDDKIAQDAALLLDRLVRQGRAFGMHILLGSQTLGGAYTLARSTIDQMAVRIALQCSEADAHLILSEDNSAARLLSRPGEAIYNDANGLVEGNNPFQVVWLADERREQYLQSIQELTRRRPPRTATGQLVFEGNAPADASKNELLNQVLAAPHWPAPASVAQGWLGEAIAIKDPTAAAFRSQSGSNLLIVGQNDEAALGILATALVSLAAQHTLPEPGKKGSARFYALDGTVDDSPLAGFLARLPGVMPHPFRVASRREVPEAITEVADEVSRRQKEFVPDGPVVYLVVYGLQRFRELRKQDDDFGIPRRGEEKTSTAKQFATILREGPSLGVHVLVWCDSLNNLNRALERQALREFELRVLFQMSVADSSNLVDTPVASKLGLHRALFHSEEQGRLEKFRPYGLPTSAWLDWVKQQFERKTPA